MALAKEYQASLKNLVMVGRDKWTLLPMIKKNLTNFTYVRANYITKSNTFDNSMEPSSKIKGKFF